jgi:hypothetical protein
MTSNSDKRLFADLFRTRAREILAIVLLAVLAFVIFLSILVHHAGPLLRARVIETLSTRFQGRVDLADLKISVYQGLMVSGKGLMIYGQTDPNIHLGLLARVSILAAGRAPLYTMVCQVR